MSPLVQGPKEKVMINPACSALKSDRNMLTFIFWCKAQRIAPPGTGEPYKNGPSEEQVQRFHVLARDLVGGWAKCSDCTCIEEEVVHKEKG